jgi:hypothetical protein
MKKYLLIFLVFLPFLFPSSSKAAPEDCAPLFEAIASNGTLLSTSGAPSYSFTPTVTTARVFCSFPTVEMLATSGSGGSSSIGWCLNTDETCIVSTPDQAGTSLPEPWVLFQTVSTDPTTAAASLFEYLVYVFDDPDFIPGSLSPTDTVSPTAPTGSVDTPVNFTGSYHLENYNRIQFDISRTDDTGGVLYFQQIFLADGSYSFNIALDDATEYHYRWRLCLFINELQQGDCTEFSEYIDFDTGALDNIPSIPTTDDIQETCDWGDINFICEGLVFLFYPSRESILNFRSLGDLLQEKAPIGYFYIVSDLFSVFGDNEDSPPALTVTVLDSEFTIFQVPEWSQDILDTVATVISVLIWVAFGIYIIRRIQSIKS